MKTLLLTGYDDAFKELGELTSPLMMLYAADNRFSFRRLRREGGSTDHPSWWKMHELLSTFDREGYDRVIWMDADMVITNPQFIPPGESGYHCSLDWGQDATEPWMLSNCCFAAFPDCLPLIRWVLANRETYSQEYHEQNHMREAAKGPFKDIITVHPSRVFASVPSEIHPTVRDPWQPGDWAAHLTMVDLPRRIELAKQFGRWGELWSQSV